MGVVRVWSAVTLLVMVTSVTAFGDGDTGTIAQQTLSQLSDRDRSDRMEVEKLNQQGIEFSTNGQFERALAIAEKELRIAGQSDNSGTVGAVGASVSGLAAYYYKQAEYPRAEPLFRMVLTLYEDKVGSSSAAVAVILNNLGSVEERQGHLEKAGADYKRALEINENALGRNHRYVAVGLRNLAGIYRLTHRDEEGAKLEQRATAIEAVIAANQEEIRRALMSQ